MSLLLLLYLPVRSQIVASGNGKVCLGDLVYLNYTPPPGKIVASFDWDFGDNFTTQVNSPSHLYKKSGTFLITLNTTFSGGGTSTDTLSIKVLPLPKINFDLEKNDTCQYTNNVCLKDNSAPATTTQGITNRFIVWGDGTQTTSSVPFSQNKACHKFNLPGLYKIEMEVMDVEGCKSYASQNVTILPSIDVQIKKNIDYINCDSALVCIYNNSEFSTKNKIEYKWTINGNTYDTAFFSFSQFCEIVDKTTYYNVKLTAQVKDGCSDSQSILFPVEFNEKEADIMMDTVVCYGQHLLAGSINLQPDESVKWYFKGTNVSSGLNKFLINFNVHKITPGKYTINCELTRGNCTRNINKDFVVVGPVADMEIINRLQCGTMRKVFFLQKAEFQDTVNTIFKWTVVDKFGENCVIDRAKNQNKYKNCNNTIGWFAKHEYSIPSNGNFVQLDVIDTATGCSDAAVNTVDLGRCGQISPFGSPINLCQGSMFNVPKRLSGDPLFFSLDTGKTWLEFPTMIDSNYQGWYKVGFIYQWPPQKVAQDFGDDSIQITINDSIYNDTFFVDNFLKVIPKPENKITFNVTSGCKPRLATLNLSTGKLKKGEYIFIDWGDSLQDQIIAARDTALSSIQHEYQITGINKSIKVVLGNEDNCEVEHKYPIAFGHQVSIHVSGTLCNGNSVCVNADIIDVHTGKSWELNPALGQINWIIDGLALNSTDFKQCDLYKYPGNHSIQLITINAEGCIDTVFTEFEINGVEANMTNESVLDYCRGLRQLIDSSSMLLGNTADQIGSYEWYSSDQSFSSTEQNPIVSFEGKEKKVWIFHVVKTKLGCADTVAKQIRVLKSYVRFEIPDSVGCAPHTVTFTNHSQGTAHFIWEMGDQNNSTIETFDTNSIQFTYPDPGRYFIRLIGTDSALNEVTNQIYYCNTFYPELDKSGLSVVVLPNYHPGLDGPDTLCLNQVGNFFSRKDTTYGFDKNEWLWGDGESEEASFSDTLQHAYNQSGWHKVELTAWYQGHPISPQCVSPADKLVYVPTVKAQFNIDQNSRPPLYNFTNTSIPDPAKYLWDFGHPESEYLNRSTEKNPSHNYGTDKLNSTVCLKVTNDFGCIDTTCLDLEFEIKEGLDIYNVFTVDNDGINDEYVVDVIGMDFYEFIIYNRWGEVVFKNEGNQVNTGQIIWNGQVMNSGEVCPEGTYFYLMNYSFTSNPNKKLSTNGTITLIR